MSLLRIVDRAGVLSVINGEEAVVVAELIMAPIEVVQLGLDRLIERGVVILESDLGSDPEASESDRRSDRDQILDPKTTIVIGSRSDQLRLPSFTLAQECRASDVERKRKSRELAASGHQMSPAVTSGHQKSQLVTPSRAVPCRAVPSCTILRDHVVVTDRLKPLKTQLLSTYEAGRKRQYAWGGARDTKALETLAGLAADEEILARWDRECQAPRESGPTISNLAKTWGSTPKPKQPELPTIAEQAPKPPPKPSAQQKLYETFKFWRAQKYETEGVPFEADNRDKFGAVINEPDLMFINAAFKPMLEARNNNPDLVEDLIMAYLDSKSGAGARPAKFPFRLFVFENVWRALLAEVEKKDAAAAATEKKTGDGLTAEQTQRQAEVKARAAKRTQELLSKLKAKGIADGTELPTQTEIEPSTVAASNQDSGAVFGPDGIVVGGEDF
jgi:hypothetical protein